MIDREREDRQQEKVCPKPAPSSATVYVSLPPRYDTLFAVTIEGVRYINRNYKPAAES